MTKFILKLFKNIFLYIKRIKMETTITDFIIEFISNHHTVSYNGYSIRGINGITQKLGFDIQSRDNNIVSILVINQRHNLNIGISNVTVNTDTIHPSFFVEINDMIIQLQSIYQDDILSLMNNRH
jgi:hypothetical protein